MSENKGKAGFRRIVKRVVDQVAYVENIREEMPLFPQYIHIEPTNACNLNCTHCHHHIRPNGKRAITRRFGMMKWDVYTRIIDELEGRQVPVTLDTQGEPTLHPRFLDMIEYARSKGVYTSVITNGTRLTEEMTRRLIELKLDRLVFSFDGIDKRLYESVRVRSKFEPTFRNVLRFIRMNHEAGHPTHVCMSMVFQEKTRDHADEYKRFFLSLPVDKVFLNPLLNLAGLSEVGEAEVDNSDPQGRPQSDWPICRIPWESMTINWDGTVGPCPVDVNVVYGLANVTESTLEEIWNNDRMKQFRRAHITKDYSLIEEQGKLCGSCNAKFDDEYDLRDYPNYAVDAIERQAIHFAHQLREDSPEATDDEARYQRLLEVIDNLESIEAPVSVGTNGV
ncbi:radical SAM protein [bacterium]|nr:radical SAM protein [bacterium]